jgi:hypothetical protein
VAAGSLTCVLPTDRSSGLRVELLETLPTLLLKDSLRLAARVVDSSGVEVPHPALAFASSNPTVFIVDADGTLRAVGVGTATLSVTALGFAQATAFSQILRVRGKLEVDSIRPLGVRFGDSIEVFGVGLDPDSLFSISIGGADAEASAFFPNDPERPEREGMLRVWAPLGHDPAGVRRRDRAVRHHRRHPARPVRAQRYGAPESGEPAGRLPEPRVGTRGPDPRGQRPDGRA